ncbi:twin-arginine translocation pathway signal protein, partial [Frankia sp. AgKG'84/4]|nr:twin-arginine translocation pathway signal protein [Frankia sp. AgKG'84/4]
MPAVGPPDSTPDQARVSRRGVLGLLGAGGWAATVLIAHPASAAGPAAPGALPRPRDPLSAVDERLASIPRTLAATFRGTGPATPGFGPGYVAVRWNGPTGAPDGGQAGPAIRLRVPDGTFGAWSPLRVGCPAERDDHAGAATPEHAVLASVRSGAPSACFELRMPPGASAVESTALNTTSGPLQRVRVPTVTAQDALASVAGLAQTIEALSAGPSPSAAMPGPLSAPLPAHSGSAPATSSP